MKFPAHAINTPDEIKATRKKLGLNQAQFWSPLGVTQSGGSRYESGRSVPPPTLILLNIAYGPEKVASKLIEQIRTNKT